jgi:hypothetical protein
MEENMSQNIDFQTLAKVPFVAATSLTEVLTKQVGNFVTETQDYTVNRFQSNAALIQKLAHAKNLDELINLQTEHAKATYEASVAWSKKLGELAAELSTHAVKSVVVSPENGSVSLRNPSVGKKLHVAE